MPKKNGKLKKVGKPERVVTATGVEKCVRGDKVGVLMSPGFGAGWSTWNREHAEFLLFDKTLVEMVDSNRHLEIPAYLQSKGLGGVYEGGLEDLCVEWMRAGTAFRIEEYDGSERIITADDFTFTA